MATDGVAIGRDGAGVGDVSGGEERGWLECRMDAMRPLAVAYIFQAA